MSEHRIEVGDIERGVIGKRIQALNDAQAELQKASELGNDTFALFCAARSLPPTTNFVKIDGKCIVVQVPEEEGA